MKKLAKVPVTPNGQWEYPGQPTVVPSPSGRITMKGVPYPVMGVDETGHSIMMMPGGEYTFPGEMIYEEPVMKNGGQHGGLDRWFAEKWVDVKSGKECGRQEGEKRKGYPACRPSKRVSEDTPKTASEMSSAEKAKFKREKTSSTKIDYQHRRREFGGEEMFDMDEFKSGGNVPTNAALWSRAKAAARAKYDVYPSAYANGFAAKWYKSHGGGWRKAEYGMEVTGDLLMPNAEYAFPGEMNFEEPTMKSGGYVVTRSSERKGKTHKVTGPDGTVKYFGDSKLGQHPKDPERKAAFYARHKKNLENNPYFRAFARKTWEEGGETGWLDKYPTGGENFKEPVQKILPSWLNVNTNTPAQIRSMSPGAGDYNLDDYAQGDISQDVRDALNNSKFKLAATKDMGKLGRLNFDTSVRPFAEESKVNLPNITYENSIGNDNRNLDVRFGPEGQSFSATSNKFIQGSADLNRTRTPEGFDTQASMNLRFPNNRGSVSRSVAYKEGEDPYMQELQAAYRMGKTNLNAFTRTEDGQTSYGAGLDTSMGPLDINGNVGFDNQGVQNYMVSGKLNLVEPSRRNPNSGTLDLTGRYGASRNQQGSMNPNYNIGLSYSNEFEQGGPTGWLDKYQEGGDQESSLENFAEFFDPTGMLSWGDAQRAYNQWQKSNSTLPSMGQALDMFGAVPGLGKLGKLKYLDPEAMKVAYKSIPWQQIVNGIDYATDEASKQKLPVKAKTR